MKVWILEEQLKAGRPEALAELFALHRDRLWRIVSFRMDKRLLTRLEPDDILQEAWLAADKRIDRFGRDGFESSFLWLRLIVNQTLVEAHRRHLEAQARDIRREVAVEGALYSQDTSVSLAIHLVASLTSPSLKAQKHELIELVQKAIAGLEPLDQEILALRHFEELTNAEAAQVLAIEPKAASIRYIRALRRLKTVLAGIPGFFEEEVDD